MQDVSLVVEGCENGSQWDELGAVGLVLGFVDALFVEESRWRRVYVSEVMMLPAQNPNLEKASLTVECRGHDRARGSPHP